MAFDIAWLLKWMCCNDCKAKEFNTSLNFPSLAPEPSALILTINNAVCATAYILVMLQQHSWDVWAVLGRSVTLWPVCPTAHMHELTEGPGLRARLSVNLRKLLVWSYFTNWPSAGLTFFLLTTASCHPYCLCRMKGIQLAEFKIFCALCCI